MWELEVKIIPKEETERGVVSFRGPGTVAVSPEDPVGSGLVRDDREREGPGVMAEATEHHKAPADHDPACEPGAI